MQNELLLMPRKARFAANDPGHLARVEVLVGQEQEYYNSSVQLKLQKKPTKPLPGMYTTR